MNPRSIILEWTCERGRRRGGDERGAEGAVPVPLFKTYSTECQKRPHVKASPIQRSAKMYAKLAKQDPGRAGQNR